MLKISFQKFISGTSDVLVKVKASFKTDPLADGGLSVEFYVGDVGPVNLDLNILQGSIL